MISVICHVDDQGRLTLPDEIVREITAQGHRTALLSPVADGYCLKFYADDVAKALQVAREGMEKYAEVFQALADG
jgi:hypothetical protein